MTNNSDTFAAETTFKMKIQLSEPYLKLYWIISEVVLVFVTCFTIYLLVCLARYAFISRCKPGRELNHKKGKALYRLCFISVSMALARFASDQAVAIVGWQTDKKCYASVSVSTVFYTLSLYPVYIFLWMRQSIFYANPVLSHILNPIVTFFSYATLLVMLVGGAILGVLYILPGVTGWQHVASASGCRDVNNNRVRFDLVPMLFVCFVVSFQISLLALFLYPLLTKKMKRYRNSSNQVAGALKNAHSKDLSSSDSHANGNRSLVANNKNNCNDKSIRTPRPLSVMENYPASDTDFSNSRSGTIIAGSITPDDLNERERKPPRISKMSNSSRIIFRESGDNLRFKRGKIEQSFAKKITNNTTAEATKNIPTTSDGSSSDYENKKLKK